jgi:hypothetical protein
MPDFPVLNGPKFWGRVTLFPVLGDLKQRVFGRSHRVWTTPVRSEA